MISSEVWMEHARLRLGAARLLFDEHLYGETLSRSYFAMFAAAKALLAAHGREARGHKGIHLLLYKNYDLDTALYHRAWTDREDYDYRLKQPDRSHAAHRLEETERFIETVASLLKPSF